MPILLTPADYFEKMVFLYTEDRGLKLANTPQAAKRVRQAEKSRQHNASLRSMARTMLKKTTKAIHHGDLEEAKTAYTQMVPVLDRIASKGLMSPNKTARHKSRLTHRLRKLSS
jgi:small subunit ribosomal protein S20